ncbi:MAG: ATP-grasp domain-containing protein [Candidatus Aenigmatarchaeota archaeon]
MTETVGTGLKIAGSVVPYRTLSLERIDRCTGSEILPFSDFYNDACASSKSYFKPMSEEGLNKKWTDISTETDDEEEKTPFDQIYDPLQERYSEKVFEEINKVAEEFGKVLIYPYMRTPSLKEDELKKKIDGEFELIAPEGKSIEVLKDKTQVYDDLKEKGVNVVEGQVVENPSEACDLLLEENWENGAFVSADSGAGGSGCVHAYKPEDIRKRYQEEYFSGNLIVEKFLDVEKAPNVLMFIDDNDSYVLSITDQIIENETEYRGNTMSPDLFAEEEEEKIKEQCKTVGSYIQDSGFRGIAGIDLLTTEDDVYFVEVNPRKNHSTVINNTMLEKTRPEGIPPLASLEAEVITGTDDAYEIEKWQYPKDVEWDMYVYKKKGWSQITKLPPDISRDHTWDFSGSYVANVPYPIRSITSKSYASQKSEGHTRRSQANELVRIVSESVNERLKKVAEIENSFSFLGD